VAALSASQYQSASFFLGGRGCQPVSAQFGRSGAVAYTGDYDNDGRSDLAVLSADKSKLYLIKSTEGFAVIPSN